MKKIHLSPALMVVLAVALLVTAACNRPDPQQVLETPPPMNVPQADATPAADVAPLEVPVNATPTLPVAIGTTEVDMMTPAPGEAQQPAATIEPATQPTVAPEARLTPQPVQPVESTPTPPTQPATTSTGNQVYTVKAGDTLFSIGRLYTVNPYAIAAANNIPYPYIIYPGQQLTIPTGSTTPPPPGTTPVPPPSGGCRYYHQVRPGENLFRISLAYGVPMSTIATANGIYNYNLIYAGQTLCIP